MAGIDIATAIAAVACGCEGCSDRWYPNHCKSNDVVYYIPRSRFITVLLTPGSRMVRGRRRLDDLILCGPCGRQYKLAGYRTLLLEGAVCPLKVTA